MRCLLEKRLEEGGERMVQQSEDASRYSCRADASRYSCRAGVMSRNEGEEEEELLV